MVEITITKDCLFVPFDHIYVFAYFCNNRHKKMSTHPLARVCHRTNTYTYIHTCIGA